MAGLVFLLAALAFVLLDRVSAVLIRATGDSARLPTIRRRALSDYIPLPARSINLQSRPDRWAQLLSDWSAVPHVRLQRLDAKPHIELRDRNITVNGCTASHVAVVTEGFAAEPDIELMLVLEDDAVPSDSFNDIFPKVLRYAVSHLDDWDIINLGGIPQLPMPDAPQHATWLYQYRSPHLLRANSWMLATAMLVNRRAVPAYLRMNETLYKYGEIWRTAPDLLLPADPALVTLLAVPLLAFQRPGSSDNRRGQYVNFTDYLQTGSQDLTRIMAFMMDATHWHPPYAMEMDGGYTQSWKRRARRVLWDHTTGNVQHPDE